MLPQESPASYLLKIVPISQGLGTKLPYAPMNLGIIIEML